MPCTMVSHAEMSHLTTSSIVPSSTSQSLARVNLTAPTASTITATAPSDDLSIPPTFHHMLSHELLRASLRIARSEKKRLIIKHTSEIFTLATWSACHVIVEYVLSTWVFRYISNVWYYYEDVACSFQIAIHCLFAFMCVLCMWTSSSPSIILATVLRTAAIVAWWAFWMLYGPLFTRGGWTHGQVPSSTSRPSSWIQLVDPACAGGDVQWVVASGNESSTTIESLERTFCVFLREIIAGSSRKFFSRLAHADSPTFVWLDFSAAIFFEGTTSRLRAWPPCLSEQCEIGWPKHDIRNFLFTFQPSARRFGNKDARGEWQDTSSPLHF